MSAACSENGGLHSTRCGNTLPQIPRGLGQCAASTGDTRRLKNHRSHEAAEAEAEAEPVQEEEEEEEEEEEDQLVAVLLLLTLALVV